MSAMLAVIFAGPWFFIAGLAWGKHLGRRESLSPEQVATMLSAAALTPISPEEAVRNGESG